jgi:hypothetical protein
MSHPYRGGVPTVEQIDSAIAEILRIAPSCLAEGPLVDMVVNLLGSGAHPNAVLISRRLVQERLRLRRPVSTVDGATPGRSLDAMLANDRDEAERILGAMTSHGLADLESAAYDLHELARQVTYQKAARPERRAGT